MSNIYRPADPADWRRSRQAMLDLALMLGQAANDLRAMVDDGKCLVAADHSHLECLVRQVGSLTRSKSED